MKRRRRRHSNEIVIRLPFSDDFNNYFKFNHYWKRLLTIEDWMIENGELHVIPTNTHATRSVITFGKSTWQNYYISVYTKIISTYGHGIILFRYQDLNNWYTLEYGYLSGDVSPSKMLTGKFVNGVWTLLGVVNFAFNPYTFRKISVEIKDTTWKTYLDDTLQLTVSDTTFLTGKMALRGVISSPDHIHFKRFYAKVI